MKSHLSLSRREYEALTLLARFRFLTRSQLQEFLLGNGDPTHSLSKKVTTTRILKSLSTKKLIDRTNRAIGGSTGGSGSFAYYLTPLGVRSLDDRRFNGLPRRLAPRGTFITRHALSTADVALAFARTARSNEDQELVSFECDWEAAQRLNGSAVVPDGYLIYQTRYIELHAFVEVDLGTEGSKFFARKVVSYLSLYRSGKWKEKSELWPTVLVVTLSDRRARFLKQTTESVIAVQTDSGRLSHSVEFAFASLTSIKTLGPLGPIWTMTGKEGPESLFEGDPI